LQKFAREVKFLVQKVKHLILLVGSNPLPNAVAGKLLVESGGTISLIYSEGTSEIAERLKNWLEAEYKKEGTEIKVIKREVNESQPPSIYKKVKDILNEVNEKSIGLNYTGGTKMMAVHAYQTVKCWAEKNDINPIFSYLDARTLEMIFDPTDKSYTKEREYVGMNVEMSLDDLLSLHDWKLGEQGNSHFNLPETAKIIAEECGKDGFIEEYKEFTKYLNNKRFLCKPVNDDLKQIYEKLYEELQEECKELCKSDGTIKLTDELRNWLKGFWLESYLYYILNNRLRNKGYLHECYKNIVTEEPKFEVDAVAIRGYQLFAFSCKTKWNDKKELKKALFEICIRAEQLGGDEARLALVCLAEDPDKIENEIRKDFDQEKRVKVFGRKHLSNLEIYLENWILEQSGGE